MQSLSARAALLHLIPTSGLQPHHQEELDITADAYNEIYHQQIEPSDEGTVRPAECTIELQ